jgi:hypothetical protein
MGIIVQFPDGHRPLGGGRYVDANSEPASVIILPVVRIERNPDRPLDGMDGGSSTAPGRRRRRRSSRSCSGCFERFQHSGRDRSRP